MYVTVLEEIQEPSIQRCVRLIRMNPDIWYDGFFQEHAVSGGLAEVGNGCEVIAVARERYERGSGLCCGKRMDFVVGIVQIILCANCDAGQREIGVGRSDMLINKRLHVGTVHVERFLIVAAEYIRRFRRERRKEHNRR